MSLGPTFTSFWWHSIHNLPHFLGGTAFMSYLILRAQHSRLTSFCRHSIHDLAFCTSFWGKSIHDIHHSELGKSIRSWLTSFWDREEHSWLTSFWGHSVRDLCLGWSSWRYWGSPQSHCQGGCHEITLFHGKQEEAGCVLGTASTRHVCHSHHLLASGMSEK